MNQRNSRHARLGLLMLFVVSALRLDAQPQSPVDQAGVPFEVASIHRAASDVEPANLSAVGGEFHAQNVSVRRLIEYAYGLRPFQLNQGPGWIDLERYSIAAKDAPSEAEAKQKLRQLLRDRFGLQMSRVSEQRRVYSLKIANRSRFHPTEKPEEPSHTKLTPAGPQLRVSLYAFSMQNMAASLTRQMEATVVDETGVSGKCDFEFTMEGSSTRGLDLLPALPDLGLKIESRRGPVEIYSIDSVERPNEN